MYIVALTGVKNKCTMEYPLIQNIERMGPIVLEEQKP